MIKTQSIYIIIEIKLPKEKAPQNNKIILLIKRLNNLLKILLKETLLIKKRIVIVRCTVWWQGPMPQQS